MISKPAKLCSISSSARRSSHYKSQSARAAARRTFMTIARPYNNPALPKRNTQPPFDSQSKSQTLTTKLQRGSAIKCQQLRRESHSMSMKAKSQQIDLASSRWFHPFAEETQKPPKLPKYSTWANQESQLQRKKNRTPRSSFIEKISINRLEFWNQLSRSS